MRLASIGVAHGSNVRPQGGAAKQSQFVFGWPLRITPEIDRRITFEVLLILIAYDAVLGVERLLWLPAAKQTQFAVENVRRTVHLDPHQAAEQALLPFTQRLSDRAEHRLSCSPASSSIRGVVSWLRITE